MESRSRRWAGREACMRNMTNALKNFKEMTPFRDLGLDGK